MKTLITLTLDQLTEQERKDLTYLLTDAFAEFEGTRRGDYVSRRYPTLDGEAFEKKLAEVERRRTLARKLKLAAHDMKLDDVPEESE